MENFFSYQKRYICAGFIFWSILLFMCKPINIWAIHNEHSIYKDDSDTIIHSLLGIEVFATHDKDTKSSSPLHTINSSDINRQSITDLTDAVHRIPGLVLRDYGGAGGMKTISVRGLGSQHTGVTYDGAPLSDIQTGQIDISRYSLENIESLSLIIGDNEDIFIPARVAASASSVNISSWRTNVVDTGFRLTSSITAGGYGYVRPYFKLDYGISQKYALSLTGDYLHADNNYPYKIVSGETTISKRRSNSELNSGHTELNFQYKPNSQSRLLGKFYYFDSFRHLPGPAILYNTESNESLKDVNLFGQLNYRTKLSSVFSLQSMAKYNYAYTRYVDVNGKYPGGRMDNKYRQDEIYVTASVLANPIDNLSIVYSADWFYNYLHSNQKNFHSPHRNSILQSLSAKYRLWRITISARGLWSFFADSPADGHESKTSKRVSPSVALSIQPIDYSNFFIRLNYKNIYRMPTFNELYFDHYGTINLKPEITDQFNLGLTYSFTTSSILKDLTLSADTYYNIIKNKIVAIPYNMFLWTMSNMGESIAYGLDATLSATIELYRKNSLILTGNYSYMKSLGHTSRDLLDWNKQLAYTPENSGAYSITWENPCVSLGMHGYGCSKRFATNNHFGAILPGYFEMGFMAYHLFKFRGHELELRADLLNAFDKRYEIVTRYPMPGRNWQISIKFKL